MRSISVIWAPEPGERPRRMHAPEAAADDDGCRCGLGGGHAPRVRSRAQIDGLRPPRPPSAARPGARRRPLLRSDRGGGHGARRRPVARAFQPRVPPDVRRDAARLSAHPAARARGGAAADDRSQRGGDLLRRRAGERRLVHHELHPRVRRAAERLPRARTRRPANLARVPACVVAAYTRPQHRTFREDSAAPAG